MDNIDINTVQFMSTAILIVLSVLMLLLWMQNKDQSANGIWCIFSVLITIDTILSCFPEIRNMQYFVYLFNIDASFAYFALMVGCFKFSGIHINKKWMAALIITCVLLNSIGAYVTFNDVVRRVVIISINTISLSLSAYAIAHLSQQKFKLEKTFLLSLLAGHIIIHMFWIYLDFDISGANETLFSKSVTPMYLILILIILALLLLTLGMIRTLHEQKNIKSIAIKKELSAAVRDTNVANKSKSIFLANMSHELRTPLNIILGFSEALQIEMVGPLNEKQKSFVESIQFGGKRLLNLINDLLYLSNVESGKLDKNFEKVKPDIFLKENFKGLEEICHKYHNSLYYIDDSTECHDDDYLIINKVWMSQILTALVDNSSKYGAQKGNIWLNGFINDEKHIRITIKDEGDGIQSSEYKNVFKPFNRAGVDNRAIEGTGTGLAIVKGLVEAMDGNIGFDSRMGAGTTFWIDLPLYRD